MKLFDRDIARYLRAIPTIPAYLGYFRKCFSLFKSPIRFMSAYVLSRSTPGAVVELRSGLKIHLSGHPHDVISVFLVFVREDYGDIQPGSNVVDIGANIGVFALYAANKRAGTVFAYEPSAESYSILVRNIQDNHLDQQIIAGKCAVVGVPGEPVRFPAKSSMYNAILTDQAGVEFEWVKTVGLPEILEQATDISLLKLDCEGAEYDILLKAGKDVFAKIQRIRMEYHAGRVLEIRNHLGNHGYAERRALADTAATGMLWYEKTA